MRSVILVSRDSIPQIMNNDPNSTDIFCKAVRINTSFSLGDTTWLLNFFSVYAKSLEYIEWTDSAGISHHPDKENYGVLGERQFSAMCDWNYNLPNLIELSLKPTFAFGKNLDLILKNASNLRILRVDFLVHDFYCMNEFMAALQVQTDLRNLKTLQFGQNTCFLEENVQMLIGLPNLELEEFIMEGRMVGIKSGWVFKAILERWSDTLEIVIFPTVLPFKLTKIMPKLKNLTAAKFRLKRTLPLNIQFPSLEFFHIHFDSRFKFDEFIPRNMEPHEDMRELCLLGENLNAQELGKTTRMFEKFPNLSVLIMPTTDEFLQTIYTSCPNLKTLHIAGSFTDVGVTGINRQDLDAFYRILMTSGNIVGEDLIGKRGVRRWKSILDLKYLETLSLSNGTVGDKSVLWGIICCKKSLKKLYLPANVTDKSLVALMELKELRELYIPSPHQGHISVDAMNNFSTKMIHVHLRCATDDPDYYNF